MTAIVTFDCQSVLNEDIAIFVFAINYSHKYGDIVMDKLLALH